MIFVDTNVFMYAVGREHPLREPARRYLREAVSSSESRLVTSAEVLQELMHAYVPVGRLETLDAALTLVKATVSEVWSVEEADVQLARVLVDRHHGLDARDVLHLACCQRRGVTAIQSWDRGLKAAFERA